MGQGARPQVNTSIPRKGTTATYFRPLRVEIVVSSDCDVKTALQSFPDRLRAFGLDRKGNRLLQGQVHELVLGRTEPE